MQSCKLLLPQICALCYPASVVQRWVFIYLPFSNVLLSNYYFAAIYRDVAGSVNTEEVSLLLIFYSNSISQLYCGHTSSKNLDKTEQAMLFECFGWPTFKWNNTGFVS